MLSALATAACGSSPPAIAVSPPPRLAGAIADEPAEAPAPPAASPASEAAAGEHWFFEWLSPDGHRALLRRIDARARSTFDARVVDVDTGATLEDAVLPELGQLPRTTIGRPPRDLAELAGRLEAPSFGDELVRGARVASTFPFGSCGRFSAAPGGGAIAFNAGDWVYVADKDGRVKNRVAQAASYDPRFTPDGRHLLFRRASGKVDRVLASYELFVVPSDLSAPPRALAGTAGARDRFVLDPERKAAVLVVSHEPQIKTCALSVSLKPPFAVKKLGCLDGGESLVESVLSPNGRYAALTTQRKGARGTFWRLRVMELDAGKIVLDEPAIAGRSVRAISDAGLLVESGFDGAFVIDVTKKEQREEPLDVGHRAFFRGATELVFLRGASVAVVDLARNRG